MLSYVIQRFFLGLLTLAVLTAISWVIIELPPGDFIDMYVEELLGGSWASGGALSETIESGLRDKYGLNDPSIVRYGRWTYRMLLQGDMGVSLEFQKPVTEVIGERLLLTIILAVTTALFA